MSKKDQIKQGGLADKMSGYAPEPPEVVWEGVSSQIRGRDSRRRIFIILAAAAGLALAISVGVTFLNVDHAEEIAVNSEEKEMAISSMAEDNGTIENNEPIEKASSNIRESGIKEREVFEVSHSKTTTPIEKRSRLEEKVIIAMQEIIPEQPLKDEVIIALVNTEELQSDVIDDSDKLEGNSQEKSEIIVNEDSLLQLLTGPVEQSEPEAEKSTSNGRWQIGASFSPLVSYRDVASPIMYQNTAANNSESAKMTYTGGVQVSYKPSKRLTVESGVFYNKMGVNIGDYSSFQNRLFDREAAFDTGPENLVSISNSMGTIVSESNSVFVNKYSDALTDADYSKLSPTVMNMQNSTVNSFSQSFEYLEIPLNVRYKILDKTIKVQLMGGLSTNFLVNNSILAITDDEKWNIGEVQDIRSINYSGNAGIGFVYEFLNSFSLSVEPRFRYYLNSINLSSLPSTRPYSFGLYTGVNYTF